MSTDVGVWLGAIVTLSVYSVLFKRDNIMFNVVQSMFLGLAAAHALVLGFQNIRQSAWIPIVQEGRLIYLIPLLLGVLLYARFTRYGWLTRPSLAFLLGSAAGVAIKGALAADLMGQVLGTMQMSWTSVDNVLFIICVLCTLGYFLFVQRRGSFLGPVQSVVRGMGMYIMMVAFGASLGYTIMARLSLLVGRMTFLFKTWLPLIKT